MHTLTVDLKRAVVSIPVGFKRDPRDTDRGARNLRKQKVNLH